LSIFLRFKEISNVILIPTDYFLKNQSNIRIQCNPDNKIQWSAIEKFEFNNDRLIEKSNVYYGAEDCRRKVEGNKMSIEKGRI